MRLSFNKCKVLNARDARKVLNGDWASGKRCRRRLPGGVQSHELTAIWEIFFFRFLSFLFSIVSVGECRRQDKMVLEMDEQVCSIDMVDCKAQSGGGDWNGHQDDNFPNDFWTQFSFIFSCFLNCISYNWCRDSFSSLWCWNPHTLTLDIQDERILVRCCPNNDNLRLDISWWTSPSEFLVV